MLETRRHKVRSRISTVRVAKEDDLVTRAIGALSIGIAAAFTMLGTSLLVAA
jgi:hypothetical protein